MNPLRTLLLLAALLLAVACGDSRPNSEALDGVYHRTGGFESETLVLRDDRFEWWFTMDEPLPDIFPLKGEFVKHGNRIDLTYENPQLKIESQASPPHFFELVEHPSPLIRSHRSTWEEIKDFFPDETQEEFEAVNRKEDKLLFRTKLKLSDDLDALWASPSFDFPDMLIPDQRDRYRRAFGFDESLQKIGTEQGAAEQPATADE